MKKILLALSFIFTNLVMAFALPGVTRDYADVSGEYVYYKDHSFERNAYIGFLFYDDTTYAVRFFAPEDGEKAEIDYTLYFTVDPSKEHLELTGEKLPDFVKPGDTDYINYMHDMFYELTARRQKAGNILYAKKITREDYEQFGGKVYITYSSLVPIFNVEEISSAGKKELFSVQTVGLLTSDSDASFLNFRGIESMPKDRVHSLDIKKNAKKVNAQFEGQTLTLDEGWQQQMENVWTLGNNALLSLNTIKVPEYFTSSEEFFYFLNRKLLQSTEGSYAVWKHAKSSLKKNNLSVTNLYYQPDTLDVTRDFKIVTKRSDGTYTYFTLTVFQSVYDQNRKYFESIIKSYK